MIMPLYINNKFHSHLPYDWNNFILYLIVKLALNVLKLQGFFVLNCTECCSLSWMVFWVSDAVLFDVDAMYANNMTVNVLCELLVSISVVSLQKIQPVFKY